MSVFLKRIVRIVASADRSLAFHKAQIARIEEGLGEIAGVLARWVAVSSEIEAIRLVPKPRQLLDRIDRRTRLKQLASELQALGSSLPRRFNAAPAGAGRKRHPSRARGKVEEVTAILKKAGGLTAREVAERSKANLGSTSSILSYYHGRFWRQEYRDGVAHWYLIAPQPPQAEAQNPETAGLRAALAEALARDAARPKRGPKPKPPQPPAKKRRA